MQALKINDSPLWLEVRRFYKTVFNIPPRLLDIMEIYDIMLLCAEGKSVNTICFTLGLESPKTVMSALDLAYDFYGWDRDLDFNAKEIYTRNIRNRYAFISTVMTLSPVTKRSDAIVAFEVNQKLEQYNKLLDKYEKG